MSLSDIGRLLIYAGIGLAVIGGLILLLDRLPGVSPGKLPGDFSWERGNVRFFLPVGTMILISIVLTIIVNIILRLFR
jgi:hypothetical protein